VIIVNYQELRKENQDRYNKFFEENGFFAFDNKQFEEGKEKIKTPDNADILNIGAGGYIKKSSREEYSNLIKETTKEESDWLQDHENLKQALMYELANHEYHINEEIEYTLDSLSLPQ
jgi:pimeloyl-CoA synthetase